MRFALELDLTQHAASTGADTSRSLRALAIHLLDLAEYAPATGDQDDITDEHGEVIGRWKITDRPLDR